MSLPSFINAVARFQQAAIPRRVKRTAAKEPELPESQSFSCSEIASFLSCQESYVNRQRNGTLTKTYQGQSSKARHYSNKRRKYGNKVHERQAKRQARLAEKTR